MLYSGLVKAQNLRRHLDAFHAYNLARNLSPRTLITYGDGLRRFYRWFTQAHGEEAEITARRIREFVAHRLASGKSHLTARAELTALRALFTFLVLDEVIARDENPMRLVPNPRGPMRDILPLTGEQVHRLLDSFDLDKPSQQRDQVICLLILDTGLRVSEVVRLSTADIDFDRSSIAVDGKGRKHRTVYIGQKMERMLRTYIENCRPGIANGHGTLFPPTTRSTYATMRPHYLSEIIRNKMDEARIPRCNSSGHRLRHTFGTNFIRGGGNVFALQRLLGHSKLDMTRRYVMLAEEDLAEAHRKASPVDRMIL